MTPDHAAESHAAVVRAQGRRWGALGYDRLGCPYPVGTESARTWFQGWLDGVRALESNTQTTILGEW